MEKGSSELRTGVLVFIVLAVLTLVEYIVGTAQAPVIIMWLIALTKAGFVVWFFMHIVRVFRSQGGH
jgi:hypothetical protein